MRRFLRLTALSLSALIATLIVFTLAWSWYTNGQIEAMETRSYREGAPGQFVTLQGYDLHYQLLGEATEGTPILLIHGFASSGAEFQRIVPGLAAQRRLIVPDLLGFGHSQRVTEPATALTQRGQAALLHALLDALQVSQVDLIGSSYGGGMALQFALDYPDRVRRIVLMDAQVYANNGGAWVVNLPLGLDRALTWYVLGGGPGAAMVGRSVCAPEAVTCLDGEIAAAREGIVRIKGHTDGLLAFSRTPRDTRLPQDIAQIHHPVLILWGRQDGIIAPELGERLAREIPGARLEWIEGAGHVPHVEKPEMVEPLIAEFLTR
jgi:pimeloyl-ACP methyl ester carboxylesterase